MSDRLPRLIRARELQKIVGLSKWTIDRMEREGSFPQRVRLPGVRGVAWLENEIGAFIEEQAKRRQHVKTR